MIPELIGDNAILFKTFEAIFLKLNLDIKKASFRKCRKLASDFPIWDEKVYDSRFGNVYFIGAV